VRHKKSGDLHRRINIECLIQRWCAAAASDELRQSAIAATIFVDERPRRFHGHNPMVSVATAEIHPCQETHAHPASGAQAHDAAIDSIAARSERLSDQVLRRAGVGRPAFLDLVSRGLPTPENFPGMAPNGRCCDVGINSRHLLAIGKRVRFMGTKLLPKCMDVNVSVNRQI